MKHLCKPLFIFLALGQEPQDPVALQQPEITSVAQVVSDTLDRVVGKGLPGASICLVLPDGEVTAQARGRVDQAHETALEPHHRHPLGSTGKTLVAASACKLILEGRLHLDRRAAEYLPDAASEWIGRLPNGHVFTVQHLLPDVN